MTAVIPRLSASADFQVRSDIAIRRHQALVNCAFTFCWTACQAPPGPAQAGPEERGHRQPAPPAPTAPPALPAPKARKHRAGTKLAPPAARRPQLADPRDYAHTLVARLVESAPAC